jgi:prepilin-type N-terminal cleavage/methylation domain-containing protein
MTYKNAPSRAAGFTLVEMAIVLVIVGFLLGGLLTPLSAQLDQRKIGDTQHALDDAREALVGFAVRYGYLPCPAISASNGLEDRTGLGCTNGKRSGFLPWATLGLPKLDSWNHIFMYSVTPAFTSSAVPFNFATPRDITISTRGNGGALVPATAVSDIPAVVFSAGKNGYGGTGDTGTHIANGSATNTDEQINASANVSFIYRDASDNTATPGGEFDDMLIWVSPNILFNRMVAAQRLP